MSETDNRAYKNAMVIVHRWERGILHSIEHFFNGVEDAVAYGTGVSKDEETVHIKVYNHHGECVHDSHGCHDGYA